MGGRSWGRLGGRRGSQVDLLGRSTKMVKKQWDNSDELLILSASTSEITS